MTASIGRRVLGLLRRLPLIMAAAGTAPASVVVNTASLYWESETGWSKGLVTSSTTFTVPDAPVLALVKSASATDLGAGQDAVFTLSIANTGTDTAFGVVVLDTLPSLLAFRPGTATTAADAGWDPAAGPPEAVRWTVGALGPGAVASLQYTVRSGTPGADTVVTNRAIVHYETGGGVPLPPEVAALDLMVRAGAVTPPPPPPPSDGPIRLVVTVFDASGRAVRTVADRMVAAAVSLVRVEADPATPGTVTFVLSDGTRLAWNGRDAGGAPVANGIYTVRVTDRQPDGREVVSSASFTFARPFEEVIESAVLIPNPATESVWLSYRLASAAATVTIRIYNVAGELVFKDAATGTARSYRWDLRNADGQRVTDGMYLVVLEAADPATRARDRQILKLAVTRP